MKREKIITKIFKLTNGIYRKFKKQAAWNLKVKDLLKYPSNTIGRKLGNFLYSNGFELLEKSERHDVFHVLTGYGTSVPEEIEMQFYLLGNGKRSPYLFFVILAGVIFYPELYSRFINSFNRGKKANPFHSLPYLYLLNNDITVHQYYFSIMPKR